MQIVNFIEHRNAIFMRKADELQSISDYHGDDRSIINAQDVEKRLREHRIRNMAKIGGGVVVKFRAILYGENPDIEDIF